MFNKLLFTLLFALLTFHNTYGMSIEENYEDVEPIETTNNLTLENGTKICTEMGLFCDSCKELVMCVETDYGWIKQHVQTCPNGQTCYNKRCTQQRNPYCDGTMEIPFKCHVPGAFPDPFDCQSYHFCVLTTNINSTIPILKDFKHKCPNKGSIRYRYDPKSTYCKYELWGECSYFPVPLCNWAGESNALTENDSIYYICEDVNNGTLYPNLFACPHGESFDRYTKTCIDYTEIPTTRPSIETTTEDSNTAEHTASTEDPHYPESSTEHPYYTHTTEEPYYTTEEPYSTEY